MSIFYQTINENDQTRVYIGITHVFEHQTTRNKDAFAVPDTYRIKRMVNEKEENICIFTDVSGSDMKKEQLLMEFVCNELTKELIDPETFLNLFAHRFSQWKKDMSFNMLVIYKDHIVGLRHLREYSNVGSRTKRTEIVDIIPAIKYTNNKSEGCVLGTSLEIGCVCGARKVLEKLSQVSENGVGSEVFKKFLLLEAMSGDPESRKFVYVYDPNKEDVAYTLYPRQDYVEYKDHDDL